VTHFTILKEAGIKFDVEVDESSIRPGSCMPKGPDGNQILLDQHR